MTESKPPGLARCVRRNRAKTTSNSSPGSHSATSRASNATFEKPCWSPSRRAMSSFVLSRSTPTARPVGPATRASSKVTSPPPHPTSRHTEPAGIRTSARRARVDGPMTAERRRSRSRPSTPPRITYLSVPIGLSPTRADLRLRSRRLTHRRSAAGRPPPRSLHRRAPPSQGGIAAQRAILKARGLGLALCVRVSQRLAWSGVAPGRAGRHRRGVLHRQGHRRHGRRHDHRPRGKAPGQGPPRSPCMPLYTRRSLGSRSYYLWAPRHGNEGSRWESRA